MTEQLVHLTIDRGVATIILDSPHNRNALSTQLRAELRDHLITTSADTSVRTIVLSHSGSVFCSGMDLKENDPGANGVHELPELLTMIATSTKPIIAKIAGAARAGGIGLIAACDIAIAIKSATFAFTEVKLGLVPAVISIPVLPLLNRRAASDLFLTGETFNAARAAHIGLLTTAVDAQDLDREISRYTNMFQYCAPQALAATKALLRRSTPNKTDYLDMLELSARHFASAEGSEGMTAFREKRAPYWVHNT